MICPNCQNDQSVTEQNYGALYTCKSCQAVYFLNFEGQPLFDDQIESEPAAIPSEAGYEPAPAQTETPMQSFESIQSPTPLQSSSDEGAHASGSFEMNELSSVAESFSSAPAEALSTFSEVAKDISDYGNTETQIAHLNYDLHVKGLDTAEIMGLLKEALEDSRFGWDVNELMRTVKSGEIKLMQLNPVKAYVLAKRLQFLDVEKIWKQNAVG